MADDVSALIDLVVSDAELITGRDAVWMAAQGADPIRPVQRSQNKKIPRKPRWSREEDEYIRSNRQYMSLAQIAKVLGRSEIAVKVRATRIGAPAPRHTPGYISGNKIAHLLGVDSHFPSCWIDLGIIEGELFPYEGRINRRVQEVTFKRWLVKPTSWVYFDVRNIKNIHVRQLVELAQANWGDEWLSTRQAGNILGCDPKDVYQQIKMGRIYGFRAIGKGRERVFRWAHWYVLRSQIEGLVIPRGKGMNRHPVVSARADAFIIHARDELGLTFVEIAKLMKWKNPNSVNYRYKKLKGLSK